MADKALQIVVQRARRLASCEATGDAPDRHLLERFLRDRDEAAFTTLVQRHAGVVLGVCRRVLRHGQDAEDASQATFLVLADRAASIRKRTALASWLYGVAYRTACKHRTAQRRRQAREQRARAPRRADPVRDMTWDDVQTALDEAMVSLPEKYRAPLVLCYLQERTRDQAATELGLSLSTLRGRLDVGRGRLRAELARRGITLSSVLLCAALSECTINAAGTTAFTTHAVQAALGLAPVSLAVRRLADSAASAIALGKKAVAVALLAITGLAASAAIVGPQRIGNEAPRIQLAVADESQRDERPERRDADGDPLPPMAVARLGTTRFRPGAAVMSLAFTPDGKELFAYGCWEGITMWDPDSGKQLSRFVPDGKVLGDALLTPDGKSLITIESVNYKQFIRVRNRSDLKVTREIPGGADHDLAVTPDGKRLLGMRNHRNEHATVMMWDLTNGREVRAWKAHDGLACMALSGDGATVATAGQDKTIRVWEVASGKLIREFTGLAQPVHRIAVAPDGKRLATGELHTGKRGKRSVDESDNRIHFWDVNSGKETVGILDAAGGSTCPSSLAYPGLLFSADGRALVTITLDGMLRVWDAQTAVQQRHCSLGWASAMKLAFSPDGKTLAVGGTSIRLFDWATGKEKQPRQGHVSRIFGLAITPDGRTVATGAEGPIQLWDAMTGRPLTRLPGHDRNTYWLRMLNDGRTLLSEGADDMVRFWDIGNGKERRHLDPADWRWPRVFSHDGATMTCMGDDRAIRLVDTASGKERRRVPAGDDPEVSTGVAFTADDRGLIVWNAKIAHVWDLTTGKRLRRFTFAETGPDPIPSPMRQEGSALASGDGCFIAYASPRGSLAIHEVATGALVRLIEGVGDRDGYLRWRYIFSPDCRCIVWSHLQHPEIHMLEIASGKERLRLDGHTGSINAFAFSADGRTLVSAGEDTTALVWDLHKAPGGAPKQDAWRALGDPDARAAFVIMRRLAAAPRDAVALLRPHITPVPRPDAKRVAKLIAALDSQQFDVRDTAERELRKLGDTVLPALRAAHGTATSLEARRRLETLMDQQAIEAWKASAERLRWLRAVEVLEMAGTAECRGLLRQLAEGAPGAHLTEEANVALQRLSSPRPR